jgi:hypothetical protein
MSKKTFKSHPKLAKKENLASSHKPHRVKRAYTCLTKPALGVVMFQCMNLVVYMLVEKSIPSPKSFPKFIMISKRIIVGGNRIHILCI